VVLIGSPPKVMDWSRPVGTEINYTLW